MEKLPPIPMPLGTRWREFRYQYLPLITFCGLVAMVTYMWSIYVTPPNVLAEVQPVTARIMSPKAGTLVRLEVERYQRITKGQIIAEVNVMTTNDFEMALAVVDADLQITRARSFLEYLRGEQTFLLEQMSLEAEQAQLAINRVEEQKALAKFLIISNLFRQKPPLETEANYDSARYAYVSLSTNVLVTEKRLVQKEKIIPALRGTNGPSITDAVERDIKAKLDQLNSNQRLVLRSPIEGTVSVISNHVGETVMAGKAIVVITGLEGSNILAYVRQPLNIRPQVGDTVQVRKQTSKRETAPAKVMQVGTQLESIDQPLLAAAAPNLKAEMGLPFIISLPNVLHLSPGERVDVMMPRPKPVAQ